jgi:hypothetical protein
VYAENPTTVNPTHRSQESILSQWTKNTAGLRSIIGDAMASFLSFTLQVHHPVAAHSVPTTTTTLQAK